LLSLKLRESGRPYHNRRAQLGKRIAGGLLGVLGYLLSPLSWWNDAFVNIPLAVAIALILERFSHIGFEAGFILGYWMTNTAGIVLMALGGSVAWGKSLRGKSLVLSLVAATAYTLAASLLYKLLKGFLAG